MIDVDFIDDPVKETLDKNMPGIGKSRVTCMLVRKPDDPGPKPASPLIILTGRVEVVNTGMVLTA